MVNRREIFLLGLLLGISSLALAQDKPGVITPAQAPAAPAATPVSALPTDAEQPAEEPVTKLHELNALYNGENTLPPQLIMGGWGSIQQDPNFNPFEPKHLSRTTYALYISTLGRYQGVRFDFPQPLPAAQLLRAKRVYLELYLRKLPDSTTATTTTTQQARPMGPNGPMGPMGPNGPMGLMGPGGAIAGGSMSPTAMMPWLTGQTLPTPTDSNGQLPDSAYPSNMRPKALTLPLPPVSNLRFTFFTEKGTAVIAVPVEEFFPKEEMKRQWIRIGIPMASIDAAIPLGSKLTRMVITSDKPAAFLIGRMAFVQDDDPIVLRPLIYPPFVEAGKRIFFSSRVESGFARVETTWNFDKGNGDTIDAKGDRTTFTFDKEGIYTVTCIVRDPLGGKDTVKQDIQLKVGRPVDTGTTANSIGRTLPVAPSPAP